VNKIWISIAQRRGEEEKRRRGEEEKRRIKLPHNCDSTVGENGCSPSLRNPTSIYIITESYFISFKFLKIGKIK
jgi:hypothetical protein